MSIAGAEGCIFDETPVFIKTSIGGSGAEIVPGTFPFGGSNMGPEKNGVAMISFCHGSSGNFP